MGDDDVVAGGGSAGGGGGGGGDGGGGDAAGADGGPMQKTCRRHPDRGVALCWSLLCVSPSLGPRSEQCGEEIDFNTTHRCLALWANVSEHSQTCRETPTHYTCVCAYTLLPTPTPSNIGMNTNTLLGLYDRYSIPSTTHRSIPFSFLKLTGL